MKKINCLVKREKKRGSSTSPLLFGEFPTPEFEHLCEWARLGAAHVRKNGVCVEEHMQNLRVQGETKERLNECDHWCQSCYFTEREKAVLNLSQAVSLHECEEQSTQILKDARRHFNIHEIVWLTLAVMAVNDWIDLQENWPEHCLQF